MQNCYKSTRIEIHVTRSWQWRRKFQYLRGKSGAFQMELSRNTRPIKSSQYEKFHFIVFLILVIDVFNTLKEINRSMKVNRNVSHTHRYTRARARARAQKWLNFYCRSDFFLIFNDHVTRISRLSSWKLWNLVSKFSIFLSTRRNGVISCKIPYEVFNDPKLERSIGGTSNRKNASTKYIELFCSFLRQIAPPYVPRFHSTIIWQIVSRILSKRDFN